MDQPEAKDINELKANPKNPRRISKEDFAALQESIKRFGDMSCVVFNVRSQQLVGGHRRIDAIKANPDQTRVEIIERFTAPNSVGTIAEGKIWLGTESYKYREVDWDEGTEKAANIAANRIQGEFDLDLLAQMDYELSQLENGSELLALTGQSESEISKLLDSVGGLGETAAGEEEAPEVDLVATPMSKLGEIYQLGPHRLMCGSATDYGQVTDLMNGKEADMIFTDPPYNVEYVGKTAEALTIQNDSMTDEEFYKFLYDAHANMAAVTKAGGSIYVCHADSEGLNFRKALIDTGFLLKQCIIWVKQTMVMGRQDYQWQHEPILYGWKEGASHFFIDDRTQTTVWQIDRPQRNAEHPTMKPLELCAKAMRNSSLRGGVVIDFFGGSGSTLMAAEDTGRICYTMELDPRYADVIRKRYAIHTGQEANWLEATPIVQAAPEDTLPEPAAAPIAPETPVSA